MVDRIPKPPREDIIKSAEGVATEGYVHQLHFYYPKRGGVQSLLDAFINLLGNKVAIRTQSEVKQVVKLADGWEVQTADGGKKFYDKLISTMPVTEMIPLLRPEVPVEVKQAAENLRFNSIAICLIHVTRDHLGDNFAVMVPDKTILFHRISKLDFLVPEDERDDTTRFMVEVTYRAGDQISKLNDEQLLNRVVEDLVRLKFIDDAQVVQARTILRQKHAYVIYDLHHRKNMKTLRNYCQDQLDLSLHGRFGDFEYINMDQVIERSMKQAKEILA